MLPSAFEAADADAATDPEQELLSTSPLRLLQVKPCLPNFLINHAQVSSGREAAGVPALEPTR